ncbi:malto-oligosyltrehalose synthase [Rurimicrobium arvi]
MKPFNPISTYRIQFHKAFGFSDLESIIPYLQELGIKSIYASPIFKAVPGSTHGYDVTDANLINPEIGTLEQLYAISSKLGEAGISWIQDIVPNHMALHTDNSWLYDVLQNGVQSQYAHYFDIDWNHPHAQAKLMLPILETTADDTIGQGKLKLAVNGTMFQLCCGDWMLPVSQAGADMITAAAKESMLAGGHAAMLPQLNEDTTFLRQLLGVQHYQLVSGQDTDHTINYRRFFTINGLIGMNMQDELVFADYHRLIGTLCDDGIFRGLRVDHVDGLADPSAYLFHLREMVGDELYIVVEKILQQHEQICRHWPVEGTTGYDFLAVVNNLFTTGDQRQWQQYYNRLSGIAEDPELIRLSKKRLILEQYMQGEVENLVRLAKDEFPEMPAIADAELKEAVTAMLVYCPVYKYYAYRFPLEGEYEQQLRQILSDAGQAVPEAKTGISWLQELFFSETGSHEASYSQKLLAFYQRCMQFTGPLMAKGVEDTMMYTYNNMIAHNEVGDDATAFGISTEAFHSFMKRRVIDTPLAMNATATHDTKRGEDARARLNTLTESAPQWFDQVQSWMRRQEELFAGKLPDANDCYLVFQTLFATFPADGALTDNYRERMHEFLVKALREAKEHGSWANPDEHYEQRAADFLDHLLDDANFLAEFRYFLERFATAGYINGLQQLVLKHTCPGVPDTYQGTELWDFSLVDPDNRRPVDYSMRTNYLTGLTANELTSPPDEALWEERADGRIKLLFTRRLLALRSADPDIFASGMYVPCKVSGKYKDHVLAFTRICDRRYVLVVMGLNTLQLAQQQQCMVAEIDWADTRVELPDNNQQEWTDTAADTRVKHPEQCPVTRLFGTLPISLLRSELPEHTRGSGVLLPVFSLPSESGIGDFGPGARSFIQFLHAAGQRYWQILPLNPVQAQQDYSPYSATSSMAINPMLISPEQLLADGLISRADLPHLPAKKHIDYAHCDRMRQELLEKAYHNFTLRQWDKLHFHFNAFCTKESWWLNDYALFTVISREHNGLPWYEWPEAFRKRDIGVLTAFADARAEELRLIRWAQFIADRQWKMLRDDCRIAGIKVIGDLPFYLNHNAAEVWANPGIFQLDEQYRMKLSSGVPPDYFSETGQLWLMPTYKWDALREDAYSWWIQRLRRNTEQFDLLRLDHFRAFESFWEVAASEATAVNGNWIKGPGAAFFEQVTKELGQLPFIAEDLGEEMDAVYTFRKELGLPGMKVLQFAWGRNMAVSVDIPHNYTPECFVYTGTHDNNTTNGWFVNDTDASVKECMEAYTGKKIRPENVSSELIRIAYASVAATAIIPMHDLLNLDASYRINTPGSAAGNWNIRIPGEAFSRQIAGKLRAMVKMYNRV